MALNYADVLKNWSMASAVVPFHFIPVVFFNWLLLLLVLHPLPSSFVECIISVDCFLFLHCCDFALLRLAHSAVSYLFLFQSWWNSKEQEKLVEGMTLLPICPLSCALIMRLFTHLQFRCSRWSIFHKYFVPKNQHIFIKFYTNTIQWKKQGPNASSRRIVIVRPLKWNNACNRKIYGRKCWARTNKCMFFASALAPRSLCRLRSKVAERENKLATRSKKNEKTSCIARIGKMDRFDELGTVDQVSFSKKTFGEGRNRK